MDLLKFSQFFVKDFKLAGIKILSAQGLSQGMQKRIFRREFCINKICAYF